MLSYRFMLTKLAQNYSTTTTPLSIKSSHSSVNESWQLFNKLGIVHISRSQDFANFKLRLPPSAPPPLRQLSSPSAIPFRLHKAIVNEFH